LRGQISELLACQERDATVVVDWALAQATAVVKAWEYEPLFYYL
jgi:hypothetical protein